jgi:V/A-type H+-transporting ATPase subunit E
MKQKRDKDSARQDPPQADLITGITQDAAGEADKVLAEARKAAEERIQAARDQAGAVLQQAESQAQEQAGRIRAHSESLLHMERRRIFLKRQEQAVQEVLSGTRERLAAIVGTPEYRKVLLAWLVEGAIGLGAPEASVNASAAERKQIDKELLQSVQDKVRELTGRNVSLSLSSADPLIPQGVVLTSADGRVEFNNQVATRMLRRQSETRKEIQDLLWKNESSDR